MRKLSVRDKILILVDIFKDDSGIVKSKTFIQKIMYFYSLLNEEEMYFEAHYYGPFSYKVDSALVNLKSIGFIIESYEVYDVDYRGFDKYICKYEITEDGKKILQRMNNSMNYEIKKVIEIFEKISRYKCKYELNYNEIYIASKVMYILNKIGKSMPTQEIIEISAKSFQWYLDENSIIKTENFLKDMELLQ